MGFGNFTYKDGVRERALKKQLQQLIDEFDKVQVGANCRFLSAFKEDLDELFSRILNSEVSPSRGLRIVKGARAIVENINNGGQLGDPFPVRYPKGGVRVVNQLPLWGRTRSELGLTMLYTQDDDDNGRQVTFVRLIVKELKKE